MGGGRLPCPFCGGSDLLSEVTLVKPALCCVVAKASLLTGAPSFPNT